MRGLPISEIDVAYFDRIYKLDALNPYIPEYKISGSGISDILAERTLLNDGMEIKTYFARGESAYRIYVTDDISHLDEHFISSLLFRGASFPDAALAVSYNECIRVRASGRLRHIEAVRFAFQALLFDGRINEEGKYTIAFDYARHNVRFCSNRLSFLMEIEYYSNLY